MFRRCSQSSSVVGTLYFLPSKLSLFWVKVKILTSCWWLHFQLVLVISISLFPQTLCPHWLDQVSPSSARLFHCKFSHKRALTRCPCAFRLRSDLAQVLVRRSWGWRGPFSEVLAWRSCRCHVLEVLGEILWQVSQCMVLYRSFWEDLVEIRVESSSRGPCMKILRVLCAGACMKVLPRCSWEVPAWRSSKIRYIEGLCLTMCRHSLACPGMRFWHAVLKRKHSVASCAKASLCCCSYDNV